MRNPGNIAGICDGLTIVPTRSPRQAEVSPARMSTGTA